MAGIEQPLAAEPGSSYHIGETTEWGRYPYVIKRAGLPVWEGYADTKDEALAIIRDMIGDHGPAREVRRLPRGGVSQA